VIERGPSLIAREDEDVSQAVQDILTKEGISVHVNADGIRFAPRRTSTSEDIVVGVTAGVEVVASHLLMAVGRRPNTDELQLEKAGVAVDARGFITVDDQLRTNVPGIWALGDCNGRGAFTHTSYNDFEIVAANLLDGGQRRVSDRIETYALYIDPPLARVGLSEAQARRAGFDVRVGMRPMTRVGRAVEKGETAGFMKIVVDAKTQTILGGTMLGVEADEAIHSILDTMAAKAPYPVLQRAMHIHPTVSELIPTLLSELKP
jgi:pyruvate/2-oxoglutarate dehydrogenase complex dihydrolipoamide dehydrogenase (E3) component